MKRVYVAGPMSGVPECNFPMFDATARILRSVHGMYVFNPADADRDLRNYNGDGSEISIRECMEDDTRFIAKYADGLCVIEGWENSRGAIVEVALAIRIGIPVFKLVGTNIVILEPKIEVVECSRKSKTPIQKMPLEV